MIMAAEHEISGASSHAVDDAEVARRTRLRAVAARRFELSMDAPARFFESNADAVSEACLAMARRFQRGGRLIVFGEGAGATDAQHVAVEFVHPVIVGKRALPSIALTSDVASMTAQRGAGDSSFAAMLQTLGRPEDIALGIACGAESRSVADGLARGRAMDMLTIAIRQEMGGVKPDGAEHVFLVPGPDAMVAQEVSETLYHVLWELVHLFMEHGVSDARGGIA